MVMNDIPALCLAIKLFGGNGSSGGGITLADVVNGLYGASANKALPVAADDLAIFDSAGAGVIKNITFPALSAVLRELELIGFQKIEFSSDETLANPLKLINELVPDSAGLTVKLPVMNAAASMPLNSNFLLINSADFDWTLADSADSTLFILQRGYGVQLTLVNNSTAAGTFDKIFFPAASSLAAFARKRAQSVEVDAGTNGCMFTGVTKVTGGRIITISTADIAVGTPNDFVEFIIKDQAGTATGAQPITIVTEGSQTIDGAVSKQITTAYGFLHLYSNGSNLFTMGSA